MDYTQGQRLNGAMKVARKAIYRSAVASSKWPRRPGGKPGPMHDKPGSPCAPVPAFVHGNHIWEP